MARIYTSRQLLDPSLISMANQAVENRIAQDSARRKNVIDAWSNVANVAGSSFDDWRRRQAREDKLNEGIEALRPKLVQKQKYENNPMFQMVMKDNPRFAGDKAYFSNQKEVDEFNRQVTDPAFIAAADEFIRTGGSSPLGNLLLQRQAAASRAAAAAQAKAEKEAADRMHKAVRLEQARGQYAKNLQGYNAAQSNAEKQQFLLANQALEKEFGSEPFGQTMAEYAEAKAKDDIEARQLAYELEQDKKEQKAIDDKSLDMKLWFRQNILPLGAIKNKKEQNRIADLIRSAKVMTDADRNELLEEVLKTKTHADNVVTSKQKAEENFAGKKTTEKLEENALKDKAKGYSGKKMNILEYKKIPEDVRQFLKIDANGNVTEK